MLNIIFRSFLSAVGLGTSSSDSSGQAVASGSKQRRRAIDRIKSVVANSKCADCGADDGDGTDSQGWQLHYSGKLFEFSIPYL